MKNNVFIILLIAIFISLVACSNDKSEIQLTEHDKESIIRTTTEYYSSLAKDNYGLAFASLTEDSRIDSNSKIIALEELRYNINYKILWDEKISNNDVSYNKNEKMPFLYTVITVNYKDSVGGDINEVLYYEEINGLWKIRKIESLDRYIPYRSSEYLIQRTPDFLKPLK